MKTFTEFMTETANADDYKRMANDLDNQKDFKVYTVKAGDSNSTIEGKYKGFDFDLVITQWGKNSFECYLYVDPNDYKKGVSLENSYMAKSIKMCLKDLPGHLEDMLF